VRRRRWPQLCKLGAKCRTGGYSHADGKANVQAKYRADNATEPEPDFAIGSNSESDPNSKTDSGNNSNIDSGTRPVTDADADDIGSDTDTGSDIDSDAGCDSVRAGRYNHHDPGLRSSVQAFAIGVSEIG